MSRTITQVMVSPMFWVCVELVSCLTDFLVTFLEISYFTIISPVSVPFKGCKCETRLGMAADL